MVKVAHPPLFLLALKGVLHFGCSELAFRSIPVLAGILFPLFVMRWVRRRAGDAAGLCALLLLTFSPSLAGLSAEVRAYTLAFLAFAFGTMRRLTAVVSHVMRLNKLEESLWGAAGGFDIQVLIPAGEVRPFSNAIAIFRSSSNGQSGPDRPWKVRRDPKVRVNLN